MSAPILEHVELAGERVSLRPIRPEDARESFDYLHQRREILDWLIWNGPESVEDMQRLYGNWRIEEGGAANYHLALTELASGAFSGSMAVRFIGHAHSGDLGYWVAPEYWNRGLATEALGLFAWLAFNHLDSALLYARVFQGNDASSRVLAKCGYQPDHVSTLVVRGEERRLQHWSLTPSGWREQWSDWEPARADVRLR